MEIKKKHGGAQQESMLIKYYADQWGIANGYPLQERRYNKTVSRRPSSAVLRSSGPKQRPERVATKLGVSGESVRRDVPADDNVFNDKTVSDDYKTGGAYKAILNMFATQLDDEKFAAHCKKFFKGEDENNT